ncbi:hypothetical protein DSC45_16915 [Streptomyces sp. YIM 130001]|uniref:hypothetical protein n=1 Tax=Streptomyces sp. YIM 130001 TaxID=2259644 RepID=UPI000E65241E|nr:hypothetical protein [Streptomyces sp. YIM 130001]RII15924.1 hypothetical protein DSC45_16915 [Streptomyces sp. YIM 130001]
MTHRPDLLALTPDVLAKLANRGLVKRAEKDLAAGTGPTVTTDADGTVLGTFPDGTAASLPSGAGLDGAVCGCPAPGTCRHVIGIVLAYRAYGRTTADTSAGDDGPGDAGTDAPCTGWSPGTFGDDALEAAFGRAALAAARRARRRGYTARLHRPTSEDPVPRAELPACTVGFPVPDELGYAYTDAAGTVRGEVVTLAVWAFRTLDAERPPGPGDDAAQGLLQVSVGPAPTTTTPAGDTTSRIPAPQPPDDPGSVLGTTLALVDDLLLNGVQQAGPVFAGSLHGAQDALVAAGLHWPAGAVADLGEQLDAYATRGSRYSAERFALLLAELHARHRASATDPAAVLGTGEVPVTPLRRVRLIALGCRIGGTARDRTAETYFAHADAGVALVLRKRWEPAEGQELNGHDLAARRLLGSPLRALAVANVVSERTSRAADRTVTLSRGRTAATGITPVGTAWTTLPDTLLLTDTAAHLRAAGDRPPRLIRPRVEAESVRVVAVDRVESIGYDPARQQLEAILRDPAGNELFVRSEYNPLCPGGLDSLSAALAAPGVIAVSGMLNHLRGDAVLDPLAVLTSSGVVVPDLASGSGDTALATAPPRPVDPLRSALDEALVALSAAAHHGLCRLPGSARRALSDSAARLHRTGLHTASRLLHDLLRALDREDACAATGPWLSAVIHLATSLDLHDTQPPPTGRQSAPVLAGAGTAERPEP